MLPWQAHRTRERLEARSRRADDDLSDVTVLIPARDEAALIGRTIAALKRQGRGLEVIVIDDQSSDGTADVCARARLRRTRIAIELARDSPARRCRRAGPASCGRCSKASAPSIEPFVLLLDADIELAPGMLPDAAPRGRSLAI